MPNDREIDSLRYAHCSPFTQLKTSREKFGQEFLGGFVEKRDEKEEIREEIKRLEKRIEELLQLLKFVFDDHVIINGKWVKIK